MSLYLAPMEGITTYVYRRALEKHYGGMDKYFTPFLTASHLKGRELREVHPDNNEGLYVVPQILTNDAELFVTITSQLVDLGYREVNLNLGCPSGTVVSKGRGAGFLDRTEELDKFLYTIYDELTGKVKLAGAGEEKNSQTGAGTGKNSQVAQDALKISVKTRIGMEFESEWEDILEIYKKYPISELIIHPRLRSDFYSGRVRMDAYKRAMEVLGDMMPLCYNGDITSVSTYREKLEMIGGVPVTSDGEEDCPVMIGRGVIMNPELPGNIKNSSISGTEPDAESAEDPAIDKKRLRAFLKDIVAGYLEEMSGEKQVVMKMKELWSYMSLGLKVDKQQLKAIHKATKLSEYKSAEQMILLR